MVRNSEDSPQMQKVRPLDPSCYSSAARLLAHAFYTNPAHVYMCPDPKTRLAQLEWVLGRNLRVHVEADPAASFCLRGDSLDAIGYWTRPHAVEIGLLPKIRAGFLKAPFRFGWSGFRRLLEVDAAVNRHCREALGDESFWYLSNLVVREKLRGTGVGTQLIREQLRIVMEQDTRAAVGLSTQREENVTFYRRLGFEIVSEQMIGRAPVSFRNWTMRLAPGAQS